ncbi:MAG: hypothetical protein HWD84_11510 [Flavobacteriaceae bacterium]|nr:hypothetical protein [Flavobacteriaceae bacterium]
MTLVHHTGVSWPRSGHHLLVRLLKGYFGERFGYCEFHQGHPTPKGLGPCCKRVPCAHADRVALSKNHDFDLDVPQIPGHRYLVQYRDFTPSVVSNFELAVRAGLEDSAKAFRGFASQQFDHYEGFTRKWVHSDFMQGQLLLHYDALTGDPEATLARVVQAMAPGAPVDAARIRDAVASADGQSVANRQITVQKGAGVRAMRRVEEFRHHDARLFAQIARLKLRRDAVLALFHDRLGRAPAESNMLAFQGYDSLGALDAMICATPEYRKRQASGGTKVAETETRPKDRLTEGPQKS